ncbi:hypothetical protein [Nocardia sp. NPDC003963]
MGTRRSPQEKKAISYVRDRRNDYGENDKSSRKNIRRNKQLPNRADRHRERRTLASATGPVSPEAAEDAEVGLRVKKSMWMTKRWRKWRDAPLGQVVARKLERRVERGSADPESTRLRIERIRKRTGSVE